MRQEAPAPGFQANLRDERVSQVFRQLPVAAGVNAVNAAGTLYALSRAEAAWPGPVCWFAAMAIVVAGRLFLWWADRRTPFSGDARARIAVWGSLATGLTWGLGAALLLPHPPAYQLFVAFVVGGMCAGSVTTSAAHLPTLAAFVLSASLPLAARFFVEGSPPDVAMGVMGVIFAGALMFTGRGFSRSYGERLELQWELNRANRQLRDEIAEHQATEATLRQAQKLDAIGQLTAGIAHDFNNLLMTISGHADMLRAMGLPAEMERRVTAIRDATMRGSQLTRQLLAFGRRQLLEPRPVDLNGLLGEMARLLGRTLRSNIEVAFRPEPGLWPVFVDPAQIEHAILNLAINARDAMPEGGVVTIAAANVESPAAGLGGTFLDGMYVRITVSDTGTGMPEDVLSRAVEPFFTTKAPGRGSGLGLSQVYGLVHQSGGTLQIRSREGQGTAVELYLPRAHVPDGAAEPMAAAGGRERD